MAITGQTGCEPRQVRYRPDDGRELATVVVETLADVEGVDAASEDLGLHGTVPADVLEMMTRRRDDGDEVWRFEFTVRDHVVSVDSDGSVIVVSAE